MASVTPGVVRRQRVAPNAVVPSGLHSNSKAKKESGAETSTDSSTTHDVSGPSSLEAEKAERQALWGRRTVLSPPSVFRASSPAPVSNGTVSVPVFRERKFHALLNAPVLDIEELRKLSWSGVPPTLRAEVWKLLLGYLPEKRADRDGTLLRRRAEYAARVQGLFSGSAPRTAFEATTLHQVELDSPRTHPSIQLFKCKETQQCLERIMFDWAVRHPGTGYVQGMMDLAAPIFSTFVASIVPDGCRVEDFDTSTAAPSLLADVEADVGWCTSHLLDSMQDNFSVTLDGVQHMAFKLQELMRVMDPKLFAFLTDHGVDIRQFTWRWMICLLTRELPPRIIPRMWDAYFAEADICAFHIYVCAAFLSRWSPRLCAQADFNDAIVFLQCLPTHHWTDDHASMLLSEAFVIKSLYHGTGNMHAIDEGREAETRKAAAAAAAAAEHQGVAVPD